jgi:transcriptional regulator with XRE-family HTH domain
MEIQKMGNDKKAFPELRAWMREAHYRQEDVARFLDVSEPTMSRYLSGTHDMGADDALRLSLLTGIPPEKLVADPETVRTLKLLGRRSSRGGRNAARISKDV